LLALAPLPPNPALRFSIHAATVLTVR